MATGYNSKKLKAAQSFSKEEFLHCNTCVSI